jgi:hypothetical protein
MFGLLGIGAWTAGMLALLLMQEPGLPDAQQMKTRALANWKKSELALENYSCTVREQDDELNSEGTVKRRRSTVVEQFYVNGVEIDHTLRRDGKALSAGAAHREQERVDKEVKKYTDAKQVQKEEAAEEKQVSLFLQAVRFTNGRRETRDGRSIIVYHLSGDPQFHATNIEGRFAQALTGQIWLDEETGTPVEMRVHTDRDLKIAGGLLANVHKGFRFHFVQQHEPDGAWILKSLDGTGDARAALFLHPRFRFRQDLDGCHLFSVNTKETTANP